MKKQTIFITVLFALQLLLLGNVVAQKTVKIGNQSWATTNLDVSTYRNGDEIPQVEDVEAWAKLTKGAWCYYDNKSANGPIYGKLYNLYAVTDKRGLAPKGFHIPTDAEWTILTDYLGGKDAAGGKMKEAGTSHWLSPNTGATNSSGFKALPGGYRYSGGTFGFFGNYGLWWSNTQGGTDILAWDRFLYSNDVVVGRFDDFERSGMSVRCIAD
jgi:uncharacterized protein (TIGR02145 family)